MSPLKSFTKMRLLSIFWNLVRKWKKSAIFNNLIHQIAIET